MAVKSINTIKSYLTEGKYPTASELVNVLDTLVSIGQNSGGDTSGLADVAISGDYNDLTNKPTVPTISTNITSDAASDTKTASPKAVKDFVEGKGYLTEHQDISGKADQTDLEALEDRVETLEQGGSGGGDTTQYSHLKLIPDLDGYTEAPVGEIVKYIGQSNNKYTRGWDYEKVSDSSSQYLHINTGDFYFQYNNSATIYSNANDGAVFMEQKGSPIYKLVDQKENIKWMNDSYSRNSAYLIDGTPVHIGDKVILDYANADGKAHHGAVITEIATVDGDTFTVISPKGETLTFSYSNFSNTTTVFYFVNADNAECITFRSTDPVNTSNPTSQSLNMLFPNDDTYINVSWVGHISEEDIDIASSSAQPASYSWQPIIHPSAPISSGD